MGLVHLADLKLWEPFPGLHGRVVHTDTMSLAYWDIDEGAELPEHQHVHEQVVNVVSGSLEMTVEGRTHLLDAGSVLTIPSNVPHGARAITACRVIDVFHPVREEYR